MPVIGNRSCYTRRILWKGLLGHHSQLRATSHSRSQIRNESRISNGERSSRKICGKSAKSQKLPQHSKQIQRHLGG